MNFGSSVNSSMFSVKGRINFGDDVVMNETMSIEQDMIIKLFSIYSV